MYRFKKVLPALVAVMLLLISAGGCNTKETIKIFAAASLEKALTEINDLYMQKNSSVKIEPNFNGSGSLQTQIEQSPAGSCDIFISAAAAQMDNLQNKNLLLDNTRKNMLNNNIVLIVPKDSTLNITSFSDLTRESVKTIAIGAPDSVPAGAYAKETFELIGIFNDIQPKLNEASNVTQVLQWVGSGNADVGIVYSTDAQSSEKVKVVAQGPAEINAKIVYPAAILKESKNQDAATKYMEFLFSDEAKAIFEKYGFAIAAQ